MKEVGGKPLYFIKPDASQKQAIKELNAHVWNKSLSNYVPELNAYVFWGLSSRWGCTLKHYPKNKVSYSLKWLGGFSDERCNVGYDYAGRTIKTEKFSFYGRIIELPNLIKPNIRAGENGNFIVSLYKS